MDLREVRAVTTLPHEADHVYDKTDCHGQQQTTSDDRPISVNYVLGDVTSGSYGPTPVSPPTTWDSNS